MPTQYDSLVSFCRRTTWPLSSSQLVPAGARLRPHDHLYKTPDYLTDKIEGAIGYPITSGDSHGTVLRSTWPSGSRAHMPRVAYWHDWRGVMFRRVPTARS